MSLFLNIFCKRLLAGFLVSFNIILFFISLHLPDILSTHQKACNLEIIKVQSSFDLNYDNDVGFISKSTKKSPFEDLVCKMMHGAPKEAIHHVDQDATLNALQGATYNMPIVTTERTNTNSERMDTTEKKDTNSGAVVDSFSECRFGLKNSIDSNSHKAVYENKAYYIINLRWNPIQRSFCSEEEKCSIEEARSIVEDSFNLSWPKDLLEDKKVEKILFSHDPKYKSNGISSDKRSNERNDISKHAHNHPTNRDQQPISKFLATTCHVNLVRRSLILKLEYIQLLILFGTEVLVGFVVQLFVTIILLIIWWMFFWNSNSLTLRQSVEDFQVAPDWILRDRYWHTKFRDSGLILQLLYSWTWFLLEGVRPFNLSCSHEYKLTFDEENPLIIMVEYPGYLNALASTTRNVREELLTYERLDTKSLITSKAIYPVLFTLFWMFILLTILLLTLALRLNIFFAIIIYVIESFICLILVITGLLSYRVVITDQRIGILSFIPFRGSFLISIWNSDIEKYFFNRDTGAIVLFKKKFEKFSSIYQEDTLETTLESEYSNSHSNILNRFPFLGIFHPLSWFTISKEGKSFYWEIFNKLNIFRRNGSFHRFERSIFPNHDWIQLHFGLNDAMVVRDVLQVIFEEVTSLQVDEELEDDQDSIHTEYSEDEHMVHRFM